MRTVLGIKINDVAFKYLQLQRGDLADLRDNEALWLDAYFKYLRQTLQDILPFVDIRTERIMDIGSGLGIVDLMLQKNTGCHLTLIDGENAPAHVSRQDVPFLSRAVIDNFMRDNDIEAYSYLSPERLILPDYKMDIIFSFGSWCFHYPPDWYLPFVMDCCKPSTQLIIDMRVERPNWYKILESRFVQTHSIRMVGKWERTRWQLKI